MSAVNMSALVQVFAVIVLVSQCIFLIHQYWKRRRIPYSLWTTIFGSLKFVFMRVSLGMFCNELYEKTKDDYIAFHIVGKRGILIKNLDLVKRILVKDFPYFSDRPASTSVKDDLLGSRLLFVANNPLWRFLRSKVSPAFSSGRIKFIYPNMVTIGDNFVECISENEGKQLDIKEYCAKYSTDIVTSCAFGVHENSFKNDESLSRKASRRIFVNNFSRGVQFNCCFVSPFLVDLFGMKFLDWSAAEFVEEMYEGIKQNRKTEEFRNDYVGNLIKLEEQNIFRTDDKDSAAQAAQFFLAGFETVASVVMFTLYELAHNQSIQNRLRNAILNGVKDANGELTYESIREINYLVMVMNETMRKYPALPFLDRKALKDYPIPNSDVVIEKGTNVYISLQAIHRDPKYFPNPMKFDPERFSDENKDRIVNNSYLPFGDGPRSCIGARFGKLSVMVALAKIVQNFKISGGKFEEITFDSRGVMLSPDRDVLLTFNRI